MESDLILHERPPFTPEEIGFSSRTRLELFTEIVGDTPDPEKSSRFLFREQDAMLRAQMYEPDFADTALTFGRMRIGDGRAFSAGDGNVSRRALDGASVGKRYEVIDGRRLLIEAVEHRRVRSMLEKLPRAAQTGIIINASILPGTNGPISRMAGQRRSLPASRLASQSTEQMKDAVLAFNTEPAPLNSTPAFVLDWQLLSTEGLTDFTLAGDVTWLCSDIVNFYGTTRIGAGTVVKFEPYPAYAVLQCFGPVICETDPYRPAFFTSKSDATVGEPIDSSTTPQTYFQALAYGTYGNQLQHLRIRYADYGLHGFEINLKHSQISHCGTAFYTEWGPCRLGNVLVHDVTTAFGGTEYTLTATHLTVDHCSGVLLHDYNDPAWSSAQFINSLLVNLESIGDVTYSVTASPFLPASPSPFQTFAAGSHYLANGSPYRGAGVSTIDPLLLSDLKNTTTWPPILKTGTLNQNTVLAPAVPRNSTSNPDLGYAYDAMDYLVRDLHVSRASTPVTLLVTNGAVLGFDPSVSYYGLNVGANSDLVSAGLPDALNRFVLAHSVQENGLPMFDWWGTFTLLYGSGSGTHPNATFRFTDLSLFSGWYYHLSQEYAAGFIHLGFQDSQVRGGGLYLAPSLPQQVVGITNTLLERLAFTFHPYENATLHARNNLFFGGTLTFDMQPVNPYSWTFYDNLFDGTVISQLPGNTIDNDYNAYVHTAENTSRLNPESNPIHDRFLSASPDYQVGRFGRHYLPATATQLIDKGSRTAAEARLYHFTTTTAANGKEAASTVDIGLHYVATSSQNLAPHKFVKQSSTLLGADAARAIDADTSGSWGNGSVTHTDFDNQAWWELDLGYSSAIDTIHVWNRTDCCGDRLNDFYVLISDVAFESTSLDAAKAQAGVSSYYVAGNAGSPTSVGIYRSGRYIRVQLSGQNYLSIAEVQVFSVAAPVDTENDGFADYAEDLDGDGTLDSGEPSFLGPVVSVTAPTDGFSVNTTRINLQGTVAHNSPIKIVPDPDCQLTAMKFAIVNHDHVSTRSTTRASELT